MQRHSTRMNRTTHVCLSHAHRRSKTFKTLKRSAKPNVSAPGWAPSRLRLAEYCSACCCKTTTQLNQGSFVLLYFRLSTFVLSLFICIFLYCFVCQYQPSVLWCCWLGGRKGTRPVKNWVVRCWCGCLSGARCRLAYGPADVTATHCLLLQ